MESAEKILGRFKKLKTLPHVALRLNRLLSDHRSTVQDFEKIIEMDPTLVVRLLRIANSSYFGQQHTIDSISRALMLVGMRNLHGMIFTSALRDIFEQDSGEEYFSRARLWLHSTAVGICSKMISELIFGRIGEDAYLCGILHDIGLIVEDQVMPELFLEVCQTYDKSSGTFPEHEQKILGTDHCELGYLLAREWGLPESVQEGIRSHHQMNGEHSPDSPASIIQVADALVSELNYTVIAGMDGMLSPDLTQYIVSNVNEYKALVKALPDEMEKAKELFDQREE